MHFMCVCAYLSAWPWGSALVMESIERIDMACAHPIRWSQGFCAGISGGSGQAANLHNDQGFSRACLLSEVWYVHPFASCSEQTTKLVALAEGQLDLESFPACIPKGSSQIGDEEDQAMERSG